MLLFFLLNSREIAEGSPYLEALRKKDVEVLFLYEPYDELVLMNVGQVDRKNLKSVENELVDDREDNYNKVDEEGIDFFVYDNNIPRKQSYLKGY